jgi:hypothetical protein
MGAVNVVLEGPTDQLLLSEMIRHFVRRDTVNEYLDLNSVMLVSAESVCGVEKLLLASRWGDEPIPTVVVVLDNDQAGVDVRNRIIGQIRDKERLLEEEFVRLVSELIEPESDTHAVVTIEDIVPASLYADAFLRYVEKWYPDAWSARKDKIRAAFLGNGTHSKGLAATAKEVFSSYVIEREEQYDKFGVAQELVPPRRKS